MMAVNWKRVAAISLPLVLLASVQLVGCSQVSAKTLTGGVEQYDVAKGWIPEERLGLDDWKKRVAPKLKVGLAWSDNLLPASSGDAIWVKIPDWLAGEWHINTARFIRDVGPPNYEEVTNIEDDAFGYQQDKNGGYWHMLRVPATNMTETDSHYARFIHHTQSGSQLTPAQFVIEGENMELRVSKKTGKIDSIRRRHDRYSWLLVGNSVQADDHVEYLDQAHKIQKGSEGTVKARPTKVAPYKRIDRTPDGFDVRQSFIDYLTQHGLQELVPTQQ
ncbi:MAG: hypothetical protein JSS86_17660 [Cyanobacteria bacterium SZAS LIN-2]|nr:hypothetical protein [Cyanobacteria bacterium SZAS LIN-3]MBS1998157.1 hypothetical protein [Cyanobacteria bacterium SZAS LIN-2]